MHSHTYLCFSIAITMSLFTGPVAAAVARVVPSFVNGCSGCHGVEGISATPDIPSIAGMSDFYLEGQMLAYQTGQRHCPNAPGGMCDLSKALTSAQIKDIGTYYASQPWMPAPQRNLNPIQITKGRRLHATSCENCHTLGGRVAADDSGILAGQWQPYLELVLKSYQAGTRLMPDQMKIKIQTLSSDDLDALAQFYASEGPESK